MKRIMLISMMAVALTAAYSQDLEAFQTGFTSFAGELAPTLSYNATVGNNWSDAYIGNFPHFGVGAALGVTTVPVASLEALFSTMDIALPEELKQYGLPIPAAAISAKLGGFILPFDIGLKGMVLPESLKATLAEAGIAADYRLIGGNIRYAVLKENILLPDVSIGAGYNRLSGAIVTPLGVDGQSFSFNDGLQDHTLAVTDPDLALRWTTDSFDFTLQVSKNLLFIRPFAGLGYSLGTSSVRGGIESALTYDGAPVTAAQVDEIKANLALADISVPDLSADGFLFGAESAVPTLRVYGGVSLALFFLNLDASVTYVPATRSLGASAMLRVQL